MEPSNWFQIFGNLRRRTYPLPQIQGVLHRQPGYKNFTKIDLSMCYYTFELGTLRESYTLRKIPIQTIAHQSVPSSQSVPRNNGKYFPQSARRQSNFRWYWYIHKLLCFSPARHKRSSPTPSASRLRGLSDKVRIGGPRNRLTGVLVDALRT
jgi:hypothetical protein